jgi:hypothetical protein
MSGSPRTCGTDEHLLRMAVLLTGDWHAAEYLVQASLAKLYRDWPRLQAAESQRVTGLVGGLRARSNWTAVQSGSDRSAAVQIRMICVASARVAVSVVFAELHGLRRVAGLGVGASGPRRPPVMRCWVAIRPSRRTPASAHRCTGR